MHGSHRKHALLLTTSIAAAAFAWLVFGPGRKSVVVITAPDLSQQPLRLRVAHAVNPRLPRLPAQDIDSILRQAQADAERYWGVRVAFAPAVEVAVADLFAGIPPSWTVFTATAITVEGFRQIGRGECLATRASRCECRVAAFPTA